MILSKEIAYPMSIRSSQGDMSIQATLITVGIGPFGGGGTLAGSACSERGRTPIGISNR